MVEISKASDTVISVVFCAFLLGPVALYFVEAIGIVLPNWLTAEDARYLAGSTKPALVQDSLSYKDFFNKKLQSEINDSLQDHIPCKATAIMQNASFQRGLIQLASVIYNKDCYPTFYGSTFCYIPSRNRIVPTARVLSAADLEAIRVFSKNLAMLASDNPDITFIVYVGDILDYSPANPTHKLVSNSTNLVNVLDVFTPLIGVQNIHFFTDYSDSLEEYDKYFYINDHHWNVLGALRAYHTIAERIPLTEIDDATTQLEGVTMLGSYYRLGLASIPTIPSDLSYDFSSLEIKTSSGKIIDGNDHDSYLRNTDSARAMYFYDMYYYGWGDEDSAPVRINNYSSRGTAMLVCDSYVGALERLLGQNYATVFVEMILKQNQYDINLITKGFR